MRASTKKKTIISICLAVTLVLSTIAFAAVSYAWFAGYLDFASLVVSPASNADLPEIDMWLYTSLNDTLSDSSSTADKWVEITEAQKKDEFSYELPGAPATEAYKIQDEDGNDVQVYRFTDIQMHFGRVDNLISLQPDNIMYLRLTVNSAATGSNALRVKLDYNDGTPATGLTIQDLYDLITLYGVDPEVSTNTDHIIEIKDETLKRLIKFPAADGETTDYSQLADISSEYCHFMQVAVAVTTDPDFVPGSASFDDDVFTEFDVIGGEEIEITDLNSKIQVTDTENGGTKTADTYYVYLKLAPRLEFFVLQENLLDQFVPSYMFFDTKLEIELH